MGKSKRSHFWFWWLLLMAVLYPAAAPAQRVVTLIAWTNHVWRFNDSGLELGTAWRTNDYDDASWPGSGTGLFGVEAFIAGGGYGGVPAFTTITTPMALGPAASVTTTFYLRTTFSWFETNFAPGLQVYATNLIDDGAVVYLNGIEVGRFRFTATNNTASVLAIGGPATEGTNEVFTIATNLLRVGVNANVIAVEVHQNATTSSDVIWGHTLLAFIPEILAVTNQPRSLTNVIGSTAAFTAGVSGSPVSSYTWQKETFPGSGVWGAPNPTAQNLPTYTIPITTTNHSGNYRVIASNISGSVTSSVATLTVAPDVTGPLMRRVFTGTLGGVTNRAVIQWSEFLNSASATVASNYVVRMFPQTDLQVGISSIIYSSSNTILNLNTSSNWFPGLSNYFITVNNVKDTFGNTVAPDSRIQLFWPTNVSLMNGDEVWDFHATAHFEPEVFATPWMMPDYVKSSWWGQGRAGFYGGLTSQGEICQGLLQTTPGYQPEPTLFRTTFQWPADLPASADLRLRHSCDDAAIFFLNGSEILRYNAPAGAAVSISSRALANVNTAECRSNTVASANLLPGENVLAVAVLQFQSTAADLTFGFSLEATAANLWSLPEPPAPTLDIARMDTNLFQLSWTSGGYALESTTNLPAPPNALPYFGWTAVPNMANPWRYTNNTAEPQRFFRLRK
jgi:hypothetical protein